MEEPGRYTSSDAELDTEAAGETDAKAREKQLPERDSRIEELEAKVAAYDCIRKERTIPDSIN